MMILVIAALQNLEVHQMNTKITFLNGDLDEEIYMEREGLDYFNTSFSMTRIISL